MGNNIVMARRNSKSNISDLSHNTRIRLVHAVKAQLDVLCKMDADDAIRFMNAEESRPIHKVNDLAETAVGSAFLNAPEHNSEEIAGACAEGNAQKYAFAMFRQVLRDERLAKTLK
jgi:hypothetical protein